MEKLLTTLICRNYNIYRFNDCLSCLYWIKCLTTFSVNTYSIIISTKLYQVCTSEALCVRKSETGCQLVWGRYQPFFSLFSISLNFLFTFNLLVVLGLHPCGQYSASCSSWGCAHCSAQAAHCSGFCRWRAGSRGTGFRSCSTRAQQFRLEGSRAQAPKLWS